MRPLARAILTFSLTAAPLALASPVLASETDAPATDIPVASTEATLDPGTVQQSGARVGRGDRQQPAAPPARPAGASTLTAADADAFVTDAERQLLDYSNRSQRIFWVQETYITPDTEALAAAAGGEGTALSVRLALEAARFNDVPGISEETRRRLVMLRTSITLPAPTRAGAAEELATIVTRMSSAYGRGRGTLNGAEINGSDIEAAMGTNRDPVQLAEMWNSWHANVGAPLAGDYAQMVELANAGARELGFADVGALWRSNYDMTPEQFSRLTEQLWQEVRPLYDALHCYVRAGLNEHYGDAVQPAAGPIRADLLGNMWAQEWGNIYELVAPDGQANGADVDVTALLTAQNYDPVRMVRAGEGFFSSLGFAPLPQTFWERSMFTRPQDREVVCHASAWDVDNRDDLRIKMCIRVNGDDFVTIHHELGHNYYQRAYNQLGYLYLNGANDGFHEAIGDMIALSMTPDYFVQIGLMPATAVPGPEGDIGLLLRQALDKVAFLPFGLLIDRWRWGVFSGQIRPAQYNAAWTALRLQYQGISPPGGDRPAGAFDAGAKYHIPASVPYTRYFLARILQFQLYEAACRQAGWTGPLHRCSFYGNREVGTRLNAMLEMGASRAWPDALEAFTGSREMSGRAMVAYFEPLLLWLREQNQGRTCGW